MPITIDFHGLFDASSNAYMVLDRELCFVAVNAAYLRVTGTTRDGLIGRHVSEVFHNDPGDADTPGMRRIRESLERVLQTGCADALPVIPYRVPRTGQHEVATTRGTS